MCPYEEKLTAWLLGDLPPEEHLALSQHLETCDTCRSVKQELSRVLTPLRSGLEKDRNIRLVARPRQAASRRTLRSLWSSSHEGLRRAAILTFSLGTLYALISVVYQNAQRTPHAADSVSHLTFYPAAESTVPALIVVNVQDATPAAKAKEALSESIPRSDPFMTSPSPITLPAMPAREPHAHTFRKLAETEAEAEVPQGVLPSAAPASETAPAKRTAKTERRKVAASATSQRPPADLTTKPVRLAGALATTNTVPTNAIPTNAVSTSSRQNQ